MNCVKGDLAEVVGKPETPGLKGLFVIVEERVVDGSIVDGLRMLGGDPAWMCRSAVSGNLLPANVNYELFGETLFQAVEHLLRRPIADCLLRPIRDPGEDAIDEMVERLGKPVSQHEGIAA